MIRRIRFLVRKQECSSKECVHTNSVEQRIKMLEQLGVKVSVIDENAKHLKGYILGNMKDTYN